MTTATWVLQWISVTVFQDKNTEKFPLLLNERDSTKRDYVRFREKFSVFAVKYENKIYTSVDFSSHSLSFIRTISPLN